MTILGSNPKAKVDTNHPDTFAICDRCGELRNISDLKYQMAWRGNSLLSTGYLVCDPCYDIPYQWNRPIFLPPDPPPVIPSRPPFWQEQMQGEGPSAAPPQNLLVEDD